jgi:hypothetical protein
MDELQMLPPNSSIWQDLDVLGYQKCQFYFPGFPGSVPVSLNRLMTGVHLKTDGFIMGISGDITAENPCHRKVTLSYLPNTKGVSEEIHEIPAHIKTVPLLDVIDTMKGRYLPEQMISCLPSRERELDRTYEKITDPNNQAYVDCLAGYVLNTLHTKCPGFPKFYGHFTGLTPKLRIDITEDFYSIRNEAWFHRGMGDRFSIEVCDPLLGPRSGKQAREIQITDEEFGFTEELKEIAEDPNVIAQEWIEDDQMNIDLQEVYACEQLLLEEDTDEGENETDDEEENETDDDEEENETDDEEEDEMNTDDEEEDEMNTDDDEEDEMNTDDEDSEFEPDEGVFFAIIPNMPIQAAIYETLSGPIDTLLGDDTVCENEWFAILFQITFSLAIAQKEYDFVHNDLHTNNLMWVPTDKEYIIYQVDNTCYKVPTYGKIIKIIDYGRSYYKYNSKEYLSDAYKQKGDAEGQYNYPPYFNPKENRVPPNPSFDLPRLACSMYEGLFNPQHDPDSSPLSAMLHRWLLDSRGKSILWNRNGEERFGGFLLYKHIARYCHRIIPKNELLNNEFKRFMLPNVTVPDYTLE